MSPDKLFVFLANSSGGVTMIMYIFIAFSHIRLQRENPEQLKVKMWLFPYLTYATIFLLLTIFIAQIFIDTMRSQFFLTSLLTVTVIGSYFLFYYKRESISQVQNLEKIELSE